MHKARALAILVLVLTSLGITSYADTGAGERDGNGAATAPARQQVIESIHIQGNRRLREEDLMYYIKSRPGDVFDPAALERDLRELLSLNFFEKSATRVLTEEG